MAVHRVQLFTAEMREMAAFQQSGRQIDEARSRGVTQTAKRRLKALIARVLENPSARTLGYFVEMKERWGNLINPYPYLEDHWAEWATFEQRLELIRQKFGNSPGILEFIDRLQSFTAQLDATFGISFSCGLRSLISAIVRECPRGSPRNELIALMKVRYGHAMNIGKYVRNLDERTQHLIGRMGRNG
jgi:hypothetical protein